MCLLVFDHSLDLFDELCVGLQPVNVPRMFYGFLRDFRFCRTFGLKIAALHQIDTFQNLGNV